MKDLAGKTAVVTGGGSGIGRGTVLALAEAGMNVIVADINEESASAVATEVGTRALPVRADVADRDSVEALAERAYSEFGAVHVLHNNAGIALFIPIAEMKDIDWRWTLSINLEGVINGLQAFLPRMRAQDEEAHIVNTASMAGMLAGPRLGAYNASKFAVVAISETLRAEVAGEGIGVSVLCPGVVSTNIIQNTLRDRPAGGGDMNLGNFDGTALRGIAPEEVGQMVRHAIEHNEPYIFTHPEFEAMVRARFERILAGFEYAKARDGAGSTTP